MKNEQISGFIRHALTLVGGIFVTKGLVDEQTMMEGVGILMSAIGFIWSFKSKQDPE
jgi:hypothetical protein